MIVFQDRTWFGEPRMGAFTVYLDGAKAGMAPVQSAIELRVAPGRHSIRVGQSWFRSPQMLLDLATGSSVRLKADIPRDIPLLPRMARFAVHPRRCLVLVECDSVTAPDRVQRSLRASELARQGWLLKGRRHRLRSQAGGPPDAPQGPGRGLPPALQDDDERRSRR